MNVSRLHFSASAGGHPEISITATASPGTLVHTAVTGSVAMDEIWLWITNVGAIAVTVTVEWGTTAAGNQLVTLYNIPPASLPVLVAPGLPLNNAGTVAVFCSTSGGVSAVGYVNRIQ